MAKGNPLQEQLLKAGLVKKSKLAEVAREQHKARHGKGAPAPSEIQRDAERQLEAWKESPSRKPLFNIPLFLADYTEKLVHRV